MRDIAKFALACLGIYLLVVVVALVFAGSLVADSLFFRTVAIVVMILVLVFLGIFEGGSKGEADSSHQRLMEKRLAERGIEPTNREKERYYKHWKGFCAAFIGLSPVILFALFVFISSLGGTPPEWQTVAVRLALVPYITLFSQDTSIAWYYPVLACLFPLSVSIGYLMGPRRFARLLRTINENSRKRVARRRKKRKAAK